MNFNLFNFIGKDIWYVDLERNPKRLRKFHRRFKGPIFYQAFSHIRPYDPSFRQLVSMSFIRTFSFQHFYFKRFRTSRRRVFSFLTPSFFVKLFYIKLSFFMQRSFFYFVWSRFVRLWNLIVPFFSIFYDLDFFPLSSDFFVSYNCNWILVFGSLYMNYFRLKVYYYVLRVLYLSHLAFFRLAGFVKHQCFFLQFRSVFKFFIFSRIRIRFVFFVFAISFWKNCVEILGGVSLPKLSKYVSILSRFSYLSECPSFDSFRNSLLSYRSRLSIYYKPLIPFWDLLSAANYSSFRMFSEFDYQKPILVVVNWVRLSRLNVFVRLANYSWDRFFVSSWFKTTKFLWDKKILTRQFASPISNQFRRVLKFLVVRPWFGRFSRVRRRFSLFPKTKHNFFLDYFFPSRMLRRGMKGGRREMLLRFWLGVLFMFKIHLQYVVSSIALLACFYLLSPVIVGASIVRKKRKIFMMRPPRRNALWTFGFAMLKGGVFLRRSRLTDDPHKTFEGAAVCEIFDTLMGDMHESKTLSLLRSYFNDATSLRNIFSSRSLRTYGFGGQRRSVPTGLKIVQNFYKSYSNVQKSKFKKSSKIYKAFSKKKDRAVSF